MNKYEQNKQTKETKKENKTYIDYDIFPGKIRLVLEGKSPTIIDRDDAIEMAKNEGKNLVQIAYNKNDFPHAICKIIDYGKFKYEQQKKEKNSKKAARAAKADVKEICFSIRIDDGDLNTKINHIRGFLSDNAKVKISIKLSRREMNLVRMAKDLMKKILNNFTGLADFDGAPTFNNGIMQCVIKSIKKN